MSRLQNTHVLIDIVIVTAKMLQNSYKYRFLNLIIIIIQEYCYNKIQYYLINNKNVIICAKA